MAKRSKRRASRLKRDDHTGCMWGLISLFDFRQGRSTRKLLSDRRRASEQNIGAEHSRARTISLGPTEKCEDALEAEESEVPTFDLMNPSVKELMEEEMIKEQVLRNQLDDSKMCSDKVDLNYGQQMKKNPKRKNRICNNSSDTDFPELDIGNYFVHENSNKIPQQKIAGSLDLELIMEELDKISQRSSNCRKCTLNGDLEGPCTAVEEKIVAAVKLFIEQRLSGNSKHLGEEGKSCGSKEFVDALLTLSSNKRVFLKLLKDPNSVLVKCIQNLDDARETSGFNMSENKPVNPKSDECSNHKHRNFFHRKSRSLESEPSGRDKSCQSSSKIVILKPGPIGSPEMSIDVKSASSQSNNLENKGRNERNTSQFSFNEIKRKLRHAMGKEKQGISLDGLIVRLSSKQRNGNRVEKSVAGENFAWSSPNRDHFYNEKFAKPSSSFRKGEQVGKLKANGSSLVDETCQSQRLGVSNIYREAKKHLSEMLNNENENAELTVEQLPKSLGRILSLPDYNSSPSCSPEKHSDGIFITARMRLSPCGQTTSGILQENNENYPCPSTPSSSWQHCVSSSTGDDKLESLGENVDVGVSDGLQHPSGIQSDNREAIDKEVSNSSLRVVEIKEKAASIPLEEENVLTVSSESISNAVSGDSQNEGFKDGDNQEDDAKNLKDSTCRFKLDFVVEDQIRFSPTVSPTQSPLSREVEISDCVRDKVERSSPVSVLEPLFPDDDISPASTESLLVEKDIQPLNIHFEERSSINDQGICVRISLEDEESAFEYVEAVLLGSGLNWDEFLTRWLSSQEIVDSSLFSEVELFSSRPHHDQKLLFDSANEALKEVCDRYFGYFSGISNNKQSTRPVPKGMDLINEIWGLVEWHLCEHQPPRCLEQLVERDLSRSGKWVNLQSDIELIGFEMWETIFDDLVEDVVLSYIDYHRIVEYNQLIST